MYIEEQAQGSISSIKAFIRLSGWSVQFEQQQPTVLLVVYFSLDFQGFGSLV